MIKKNYPNQLTEKKVYFHLQLVVHHPENSGKELKTETWRWEAETESEAMEEFSQPPGLISFIIELRVICLMMETFSVLSPFTLNINQEITPQT